MATYTVLDLDNSGAVKFGGQAASTNKVEFGFDTFLKGKTYMDIDSSTHSDILYAINGLGWNDVIES